MRRRYIIIAIVILIIVVDLCVLLYPTVSSYINYQNQSRAVARYLDEVVNMSSEDVQAALQSAHEYNERLQHKTNRFQFSEQDMQDYEQQLNNGHGVMGILVIDKIEVKLPIYHGSEEGVLQIGLGHMKGSSLPVGGEGTHAVITGHRGLPSSTLLTNLNKLTWEDTFVLYVMGETLTYQVDHVITVEPHETEALAIDPDMDYCTLVTCTPYGVNSHRLLVRGRRVENALNPSWDDIYADARRLDRILVILVFIVPTLPVAVILTLIKYRKIRKGEPVQ